MLATVVQEAEKGSLAEENRPGFGRVAAARAAGAVVDEVEKLSHLAGWGWERSQREVADGEQLGKRGLCSSYRPLALVLISKHVPAGIPSTDFVGGVSDAGIHGMRTQDTSARLNQRLKVLGRGGIHGKAARRLADAAGAGCIRVDSLVPSMSRVSEFGYYGTVRFGRCGRKRVGGCVGVGSEDLACLSATLGGGASEPMAPLQLDTIATPSWILV